MSQQERVPYQACLRVLGAELDARSVHQVSIVELPDGFLARFLPERAPVQLETVQWTTTWLVTHGEMRRRQRSILAGGRGSAQGRYQDFLRALGNELDEVSAYSLALDELADRVLLTYLFHDAREGYLLRKRFVVITDDDRREMVRTARRRRARRQFFHR